MVNEPSVQRREWLATFQRAAITAAVLWLGLISAGCDSVTEPDRFDVGGTFARSGREGGPPIQTESDRYRFERVGSYLEVEIPYRYTNDTSGPVFIVNCNGSFSLRLERRASHGWATAWQPAIPLCLSTPIVIPVGGTFHDTVHVSGAIPGGRSTFRADAVPPAGTYRIVWADGHQVSNSFRLDR